ncbi:MAG TPA: 4-hydroxybutyrate CoA-transferase, partial [Chitinophagaceae bacterium]|nr:4-hydroxybutyrate CoA-transferase [Chitinophagaceae bacterium]
MIHPFSYVSLEDAVNIIQPGHRVFVHGSACTPLPVLHEMARQHERLKGVEVVSITFRGDIMIDKPEYYDSFKINSLFVSASVRKAVNEGRADFIPVFLSDIPDLFKRKLLELDVAIVQVSPPDVHGYCSLSLSIDIARSAVDSAKYIIALVNPRLPRTHGDGMIHTDRFTKMVFHESEPPEENYGDKTGEAELTIGQNIAGLIDDGST